MANLTLTGCLMTEFTCMDGSCLPMHLRCDGTTQCMDKSDESGCRILDYQNGYDKLIVPETGNGKVTVTISVEIQNVLDINEVADSIAWKFVLEQTFLDKRLKYINLKEDSKLNKLSKEEVDSLWFPYILYGNVAKQTDWVEFKYRRKHRILKNPLKPKMKSDLTYPNNVYLYKGDEHHQWQSIEGNAIFICRFKMQRYPFDTQICTMNFVSSDPDKIDLFPGNLTYTGPKDLTQYFVYNYLMCPMQSKEPGLVVILVFGRPLIGNILTVFIPTVIIIVLAHMSKAFADDHIDMVIQANFTALLALAT